MSCLKIQFKIYICLILLLILPGFSKAAGEPSSPINLEVMPVSDTEINLTWERVGGGETSITIWRFDSGIYKKVKILPAGSNIFTDTSLYPATSYLYQITADNINGSSAPVQSIATTTKVSGAVTALPAESFKATATSPYSITLNWNDNNTMSRSWFLERSMDNVSYSIVSVVGSGGVGLNFIDTPLIPATTYYYRIRLVTGSNYSDYTLPVSAITQSKAVNLPIEPTNLSGVVNSSVQTTLSWNDTNTGASSYLIETAPFAWAPTLPTWTQVAETASGATNYNLTTLAEKFYYVRVRAKNVNGNSGYSNTIKIRSASSGTGSAKVYEIGPGKTYTSLGALNWSLLGPGDTVNVYPNKNGNGDVVPYYEKPMISVRGTAVAPIIIQGIADPTTGKLPIIDGSNAIENSQWNRSYMPLHDVALVLISYRPTQNDSGWSPGYFNFNNFEITNGYGGDPGFPTTYTDFNGLVRTYGHGCGIYIEKGDHITFKNNIIHGNNDGIFGAGQGDQRNLEDIIFESNYIYGNGTVSSSQQHNSYVEGINVIYQYNKYGPLRALSVGGGLKDRGAGTIIRYNWFQGGGHLIDLVESQNYQASEVYLDSYNKTFVYGNIFYNQFPGGAATPIHYGGDGGVTPSYRKGILAFYHNTLVNIADQSQAWRVNVFDMSSAGESLDARNNIVNFIPVNTQTVPDQDLLSNEGVAYFGKNWVNSTWTRNRSDGIFTGHIAGTANFINNPQRNAGFISTTTGSLNFNLLATSQNIDQGAAMPADFLPVQMSYSDPQLQALRVVNGSAMDLGAFEYFSGDVIAPSAPSGLSVL
ncbi:MAG: fibronectin type III domain-containing protein [bacterium]